MDNVCGGSNPRYISRSYDNEDWIDGHNLAIKRFRSSQSEHRFTAPLISRTDDDSEDWNDGDGTFDLDFETQIQHDCKTIRDY